MGEGRLSGHGRAETVEVRPGGCDPPTHTLREENGGS